MVYCYKCEVQNYKTWQAKVSECGSCRRVKKADLMQLVLQLDPVYLSESNRNKKGAPKKLSSDDKLNIGVLYIDNPKENSYSKLAARFGVSKATISNVIHGR